jgi:RNA polymerase subunit RPABC4/transcription elongation factor Spt4
MGVPATYKCLEEKCKHTWEFIKETVEENFPELECPVCGSDNTYRVWNDSKVITDVADGKCGSAKNQYSNNIINHHSKLGKYKGKKI